MAVGVLPQWREALCEELAVSVHPGCVVHGKGLRERKLRWVWLLLEGLCSAVMDVHGGEFLKTYCTLNIIPGNEYEFFLLSYLFGFSWFYRDCLMLETPTKPF